MKQTRKVGADSSATTKHTADEMRQWYEDNKDKVQYFQQKGQVYKKLNDVLKQSSKTLSTFNKQTVVEYIQNPTKNEKNLRDLSWYLYYRSQPYQRIVSYYSSLFALDARMIIPEYDFRAPADDETLLQSFSDTMNLVQKWNIDAQLLNAIKTCFIQDVSYNIAYYDETGLFLLPLPANYCRLLGQYTEGSDFAFAMDMTYFNGANASYLEWWGEPFQSMYKQYKKDNVKYQIVPDEYAAAFKFRADDWQVILAPLSGLFLHVINLQDTADVEAVANKQDIYRLVYMELATLSGSKMADDWAVNPDFAMDYADRFIDDGVLPDYTSFAVSPLPLKVVDFSKNDRTSEATKVMKGTQSLFNTAGGAQVLNSATVSGTTAFLAVEESDTEYAINTLLPQIQGFFERILGFALKNHAHLKFLHVGRLTKNKKAEQLLTLGQNGFPTKLAIMSMNGFTEKETLTMAHLEDILDLSSKFNNPLQTSYTQPATGRPQLDPTDRTDDGEASQEKRDNAKG